MHRLTWAIMGLTLLALGTCGGVRLATPGTATTPQGAADPVGVAFALLADNRLVALRPGDGGVIAELRLAPDPGVTDAGAGHYLAYSRERMRLFALLTAAPGAVEQVVAIVDTTTLTVRVAYAVPQEGVTFRSVAVGRRSGRIYLFGNRPAPTGTAGSSPATAAADVVVTVFDPTDGEIRTRWTAREAAGLDWRVYQGAVSDDEQRIFISYHGPDTGGIDRYDLTDAGLRRCPASARASVGCLRGHGSFSLYGDGLLVATGDSVILALDPQGALRQGFDTGLVGNHLMEFAVDAPARQLYAVGSCGYRGGFSAVDLTGGGTLATPPTMGDWTWRTTPAPPRTAAQPGLCGERVALATDGLLVVSQGAALAIVDTRTGARQRTINLPVGIHDVLAIPARYPSSAPPTSPSSPRSRATRTRSAAPSTPRLRRIFVRASRTVERASPSAPASSPLLTSALGRPVAASAASTRRSPGVRGDWTAGTMGVPSGYAGPTVGSWASSRVASTSACPAAAALPCGRIGRSAGGIHRSASGTTISSRPAPARCSATIERPVAP